MEEWNLIKKWWNSRKLAREKVELSYTEKHKMKYVARYTQATGVYSKSPYVEENYLHDEESTYILLENSLGEREVEIISSGRVAKQNEKISNMYAKHIFPWLNGAALPSFSDDGGGGGGGEPKPKPKTPNLKLISGDKS